MIIGELFRKWFGLPDPPCLTCEVLREQLHKSDMDRRDLLHRLLELGRPEPPVAVVEEQEMKPIGSQFIPWRVRQQMLEQEDRKKAELMKARAEEIAKLEKELDIDPATAGMGIGIGIK